MKTKATKDKVPSAANLTKTNMDMNIINWNV